MLSKRLVNYMVKICIGVLLVMGVAGNLALASDKELTPYEWFRLSAKDRLEYKTIKIRALWWAKPWMEEEVRKNFNEIVDTGNIYIPRDMYNQALFQLYHPKVEVKGISFQLFGPRGMENVITGLAGGNAPCLYVLGFGSGPQDWIKKGLAADITDLVKDWDQTPYIQAEISEYWDAFGWRDGRCYGIPAPDFIASRCRMFRYRKDFFKEAGIFNEKGKPAPPENWTWDDFRDICGKLTDAKKKRWGLCYIPAQMVKEDQLFWALFFSFGGQPWSIAVPDKTGKYTWRFGITPQLEEALGFLRDMIWKDKSVLTGVEFTAAYGSVKEIRAGRVAMNYVSSNWTMGEMVSSPYAYSATIPTVEMVGNANVPKGKHGLQLNTRAVSARAFDPTLSKEELKAAFDWADWNSVGKGKTLMLQRALDLLPLDMRYYPLIDILSQKLMPCQKIREVPKGFPPITDILPEDELRALEQGLKIPVIGNYYSGYDKYLEPSDLVQEFSATQSLFQAIASNPNVDIKIELEKTADLMNKTVLSEKIENDKEYLKEYFTKLDNLYKKYYPDWYNSKEYKNLFENYYKCW